MFFDCMRQTYQPTVTVTYCMRLNTFTIEHSIEFSMVFVCFSFYLELQLMWTPVWTLESISEDYLPGRIRINRENRVLPLVKVLNANPPPVFQADS